MESQKPIAAWPEKQIREEQSLGSSLLVLMASNLGHLELFWL